MRENSELAPCPFCGGDAQTGFDDFHHGGHVRCSQCGVTGPVWSNNTDKAIEAWNRRSLRTGGEDVASLLQALHDPENQPSQFGTIPAPKGEVSALGKFKLGDIVRKIKGSSWNGRVVGFYSTELTPIGYNVESEREPGSVQIYPEAALEANHE